MEEVKESDASDVKKTPRKRTSKKISDMSDEEIKEFYRQKLERLEQQKARVQQAMKQRDEKRKPKINHAKFILSGEFLKTEAPVTAKSLFEKMSKIPETYSEYDCECLTLLATEYGIKIEFVPNKRLGKKKKIEGDKPTANDSR